MKKRLHLGRGWKIVIALPVTVFVVAALAIVFDGLTDDLYEADVVLVLGTKVMEDGTPSSRLRARLDTVVELYERGLFEQVIVSGGLGKEGYDEAEVMGQYLVDHGVPVDRIHVDSGGEDTYLTAQEASRIMEANGMESVMVVTQYFHVSRTKLALEKFGVSQIYSAHADYWELRDLYSIPREVIAYCYYFLRSYE